MDYYQTAKKASLQIDGHTGLEFLRRYITTAADVLDVGCGEGTRLNTLLGENRSGSGIDPSEQAITLAKKHYPRHNFVIGQGEKLPFANSSFDLVYTAFAIEHCVNPTAFVGELIRVTRAGGRVVILTPNYGAPNRRSPVSLFDPASKLAEGLIKDFFPPPGLDWRAVTPSVRYRRIDDDTTFEPYLLSLVRFLRQKGLTIETSSSLWQLEAKPIRFHHRLFSALGKLGIFPFRYWGPQVFVSAVK